MDDDVGETLIDEKLLQTRLEYIRQHVARPIPQQPFDDASPALIPFQDHDSVGGIIVGSARHAANIPLLKSMNVIAVMNCASGGIARLPVDELKVSLWSISTLSQFVAYLNLRTNPNCRNVE